MGLYFMILPLVGNSVISKPDYSANIKYSKMQRLFFWEKLTFLFILVSFLRRVVGVPETKVLL